MPDSVILRTFMASAFGMLAVLGGCQIPRVTQGPSVAGQGSRGALERGLSMAISEIVSEYGTRFSYDLRCCTLQTPYPTKALLAFELKITDTQIIRQEVSSLRFLEPWQVVTAVQQALPQHELVITPTGVIALGKERAANAECYVCLIEDNRFFTTYYVGVDWSINEFDEWAILVIKQPEPGAIIAEYILQ